MNIFIIGGTGLLGAAGAKELISRGHKVASIALPPVPEGADIPKEMKLTLKNYMDLSDTDLEKLLAGYDALVFAAGVDERIEFPPPVYDYYYKYNIAPLSRLLKAAKNAGVKKTVVLGSYFSYFAKAWPSMRLYEKHPYIRSRVDQENVALAFSDDQMEVSVLQLPYIFGAQPGRKPVWTIYTDMLSGMKTVYYPKGGTTMVTVRQVAQALAGALEKGKGGKAYPIGWYNMTWKEMFAIFNKHMGTPDKKIVTVPAVLAKLSAKKTLKHYADNNLEPGLDPVAFISLMTKNAFIDKQTMQQLGATEDDIDAAIGESVKCCMDIKDSGKPVVEMKAN